MFPRARLLIVPKRGTLINLNQVMLMRPTHDGAIEFKLSASYGEVGVSEFCRPEGGDSPSAVIAQMAESLETNAAIDHFSDKTKPALPIL